MLLQNFALPDLNNEPVKSKAEQRLAEKELFILQRKEIERLRKTYPVNGLRADHKLSVIPADNIASELTDVIGRNCWSVYVRKTDHSYRYKQEIGNNFEEVIKTYFFANHKEQLDFEEINIGHRYENKENEINRSNIMQNPAPLIDDINNGLKVCISFGCDTFLDRYYEKVDGIIIRTVVDYPREMMDCMCGYQQ